MKTMNIYAKPGDKIIFAFPANGFDYDHDDAAAAGLEEGTEYIIEKIEVMDWVTRVWLEGVKNPGRGFNSVMFADCEEPAE